MLDRPLVLLYSCLLQHPFQVWLDGTQCRIACAGVGIAGLCLCVCVCVRLVLTSGVPVANACPLAPVQIESWAAWGKVLKALDKADQ